MKTTSKEILLALNSLSDEQKREVYDFIEFLRLKTMKGKRKRRDSVEKAYGLTKGSKLTADLFSSMKAEDISLDNNL
ncbi:MAG: DUF2281 domain-containing protein [bacterium]